MALGETLAGAAEKEASDAFKKSVLSEISQTKMNTVRFHLHVESLKYKQKQSS